MLRSLDAKLIQKINSISIVNESLMIGLSPFVAYIDHEFLQEMCQAWSDQGGHRIHFFTLNGSNRYTLIVAITLGENGIMDYEIAL